MNQPPTGTVTFLFTDIEGSMKLWQQHPDTMGEALRCHHALLNASITAHDGYIFQIVGDAFYAAFSTANDGLVAALEAQRAVVVEKWGEIGAIRVRMALHTGRAEVQLGEYTSGEYISGLTLSRVARLLSAGHGGQILLSLATAELVRDHLPPESTLRDLGPHRLKDLIRPEQIFQVVAPGLPVDFSPLKTLDVHSHNLPVQITSFIGREREMGEIKKLLASTHLLTLIGVGGTGKTRLALQVSADLIDEFPGGVWLVELAPLRDPTLVEQTVASILSVCEVPDRSLSDLLVADVRDKHLLLILDNCEHVVEACAQLAGLLLRNAPNLKIMATSRTHLNLSGEVTYPVPPLVFPDLKWVFQPLALAQFEAVRLFIERATAVQPSFRVTNENAPAVAQICTHLDGIPLAIELAAARTRHLSPDQISARLADRFKLLTGGSRTALPRQQTLRAAMDWSYDLLGPAERTLFNRLAVFPGSFSLEAAEAICADEIENASMASGISKTDMLDLLGVLVDHSLVSMQEKNGNCRYVLLETVHQYALEKLHASGELSTLQDRHLAFFLELAEQGSRYVDIGNPVWMERFETEYDNLRDAMEYAIAARPESAIRFEYPLSWFCEFTSRNRESHGWVMRLLELTEAWPPGNMRAMALWHAGDSASMIGDYQKAQEWMDVGLEMAREFGDKELIKNILHDLVALKYFQKNGEQLRIYTEQFLAISRELGDKTGIVTGIAFLGVAMYFNGDNQAGRNYAEQALEMARQENFPYNIAGILLFLSQQAHLEGDLNKAIAMYTECAQNYRLCGYRSALAWTLYRWGQAVLQEGDAVQASALFKESLTIYSELKDGRGQENYLEGMAGIAALTGQDERAARLFGADKAISENLDIVMSDLSQKVFDPLVAVVRERLGETKFNALWAEGYKLTMAQALELAQTMR